jgi:hypothetical protein
MIQICFISFIIIFCCLSLRINIVPLANFENPKAVPPHLNQPLVSRHTGIKIQVMAVA